LSAGTSPAGMKSFSKLANSSPVYERKMEFFEKTVIDVSIAEGKAEKEFLKKKKEKERKRKLSLIFISISITG
jgi:hypothetical protein